MAILNLTAYTNALKVRYAKELTDLSFKKACPFARMLKRREDFGGKHKTVNTMASHSSGSSDFSVALAVKGVPSLQEFQVTRSREYYIGSIDAETMAASKGDINALASATDTKLKEGTKSFQRAVSHQVWGNGGGSRGRIASGGISSATITLSERSDVINFEINMQVEIASDDGTGSSPAGVRAGTPLVVSSVDTDAGTVTFKTNVTANYAGAVANDYLFRRGDYNNVMEGALSWVPVTAPTSGDSHFQVDRSVFVNRLAGSRVTVTGSNMEGGVFDACGEGSLLGAEFDTLFMGPLHFKELVKSLQSQVWVDIETNDAGIGFRALSFKGPNGDIKVISDPQCPDAYGLLTNMDSWELWSLGAAPHFAMDDGQKMRAEVAADAVEFRMRAWWQLVCLEPINNVLLTWGN